VISFGRKRIVRVKSGFVEPRVAFWGEKTLLRLSELHLYEALTPEWEFFSAARERALDVVDFWGLGAEYLNNVKAVGDFRVIKGSQPSFGSPTDTAFLFFINRCRWPPALVR